MNLKDTYNKIGDDWFKDHEVDTWWHQGTDKFISLLKPRASVLDVGCGGGLGSKYLLEKGMAVTGIDFSEKMIEIATREVSGGKFLLMDVHDLSPLTEEFDGLYVKAVLLHIPKKDVPGVIRSLLGKLKIGGLLYVAVKEAVPGQQEEEIKIENDFGYEYQRFFSFFFLPEMEKYFTDAGLKVCYKNVTPAGRTRWIEIIGQKQ